MGIKRILYFLTATLALLFFSFAAQGEERPFITRWKGEAGKELKIPIFGENYKLVIKKAADNSVFKTESSLTITEADHYYKFTPTEDGELLVEAGSEGVKRIRFVDDKGYRGSAENLLKVEKFGTVVWESMEKAFQYCKNMQFAEGIDTPDLSNVTSMYDMFYGCSSFNQDLSNWNVSNVTNMYDMFHGCSSFNQDLSNWNVSNVTNMRYMFDECSSFNQPLNNWDVSNVTDMRGMFLSCPAFNQDLSSWDVSKVTDMAIMFYGCHAFNQPLNNWDVSKVTDMGGMFGFFYFNQPLNSWDVSKVTDMGGMFSNCSSFNQPLNSWDVSKVTDMSRMFLNCLFFNQDLSSWDVSKVTNMYCMFANCSAFNQNLGAWKLKACKYLDLSNCGISIENYSKSLISWAALSNIIEGLKLDATGLKYSTEAKKAREKLVNEKHWHIEGDELAIFPVTGVYLSQTELSLEKGKTATLTATVAPQDATNKKVTWSSNNTQVATVEEGTVTAVSEGNATITVTTEDGNHTATCEVSVIIPVTGVSLSQTELSLEKGKTATLTATVAPSDAPNKKVTWSSNNTQVATVEDGTVTAVSEGNATITVTTEDGKHTATCSVTVTPPAAVEDAIFASVVVSPNPFNAQLCISNGDVRGKYALYNTQGVEVDFGALEGAETRINTVSLPAGMYLLRLTAENGAQKTFTVVKN